MMISGFHLWQFQVFNSGAEGLVVVLFWLDLWEIFFLATLGFEPGTSGSLVLHSTTTSRWLLVFTSDTFRYLTLVQRISGGFVLIGPVRDFLFGYTGVWTQDLWISSPVLYHCDTVTSGFPLWKFQVFNSGAEGLVVVLFWLGLWEIFFLATLGFEPGTSGSLVLHSTTTSRWLLVFTSDTFRYLTLLQRISGGFVLIGPVRDFLFGYTGVWTQDLWISSPVLYHCDTVTSGFPLWKFQVFNSGAEGLVVVLFWLECERFSFWLYWGLNSWPLDF